MPSYRAGFIGLTGIASRPLPTTPIDPALGIELPHNHAAAYALTPNVDVVAVCELKSELLEKFKTDFAVVWPEARAYTDYQEMLERENLDLLSVCTGDNRHAQMVVDAACRSSSSRPEAGWCATPGGWSSSLQRWLCRECCFRECWNASAGYVRCLAEGREILTRGRWTLLGSRIPFEGAQEVRGGLTCPILRTFRWEVSI